jgi:hypothetical protein
MSRMLRSQLICNRAEAWLIEEDLTSARQVEVHFEHDGLTARASGGQGGITGASSRAADRYGCGVMGQTPHHQPRKR